MPGSGWPERCEEESHGLADGARRDDHEIP